MRILACKDIGVEGCDYVARETNGNQDGLLEQMIAHLRNGHGYRISVSAMNTGDFSNLSEPERIVAARLLQQVETMV